MIRRPLVAAALALAAVLAGGDAALAKRKRAEPVRVRLEPLGRFERGLFDESASEAAAYDRKRRRLFVVNRNRDQPTIDLVDLTDPTDPRLSGSIRIDDVVPGGRPNDVAFHRKTLAVAIQAPAKTNPGVVAFFDRDGTFVSALTVGAKPDSLVFSRDGRYLVVANEGEASGDYGTDPEGTVSIVKLPRNVAKIGEQHVRTVRFDDVEIPDDVRVFGPGASAAEDLEPESVTLSANGRTAWVTLQENNALAVIDVRTATVERVVPLGFVDHSDVSAQLTEHPFTIDARPVAGTTLIGQRIRLGGYSGLRFEGVDPETGLWRFLSHPDRGPTAEADDQDRRPFVLPDFQPELTRFTFDPATGEIAITARVPLFHADGTTPLTGLPNLLADAAGLAHTDEPAADVLGTPLALDPLGADLEGIAIDDDGSVWMCDEYRPSLYHFTAGGTLLARYVPVGSNAHGATVGVEALPAVFAQREYNRGFEAIAYRDGRVFAFLQSALDVPDTPSDETAADSRIVRIVEFDPATEQTVGVYVYALDHDSHRIGDAVAVGAEEFVVLEHDGDTGEGSVCKLHRVSLRGATNLLGLDPSIVGPDGTLESESPGDLRRAGILAALKTELVDLADLGYDEFTKPEGLARIDDRTFAVVNDDDFGLTGEHDPDSGSLTFAADAPPTTLGIVRLSGHGLDASDEDLGVLIRDWPVRGMYQPDGIAHYRVKKADYVITANEGDARDSSGFSEEVRVDELDLDRDRFPQLEMLQKDRNLGRLRVTDTLGDDGDGTFEHLYAFGTRSFSIRDADGALVFDSGDEFERRLAELLPDDFNANSDANGSFDRRSDDRGPEPSAVIVQKIKRQFFAFIALERVGGVMVYDVTDPTAPTFVTYATGRDFTRVPESGTAGDLGPERLLFIPKRESPVKRDLLVVCNGVSGTTSVFEVVLE